MSGSLRPARDRWLGPPHPHRESAGAPPIEAPDPVDHALGVVRALVDGEGLLVDCDDAFAQMCGGPRASLVGQPVGQWLEALAGQRFGEFWTALARSGRLTLDSAVSVGEPPPLLTLQAARVECCEGATCAALLGTSHPTGMRVHNVDRTRLEFLLRETDDALFDWDLVSDRLWVSAGGQRLFDLDGPEHELAGARFRQWIHPDDLATVWSSLRELLSGRTWQMQIELRAVHDSGRQTWLLVRARIADRAPDGRARHLVGTAVDITARRRFEGSLRRERDLLDAVIGTSVTALIVQDPTGALVYANPEAARMLGCTRAELLGRLRRPQGWPMLHLDGRLCSADEYPHERVLATGEPLVACRYRIDTVDGRQISVSVNSAPTRDAEGRVNRVVSTFEDITERLATENALRSSERALREVLERLPVAVGVVAMDGRVLACNRAVERLLGLDNDALIGRHIFQEQWPMSDEFGERVRFPEHPFFRPWRDGAAVHDLVLRIKTSAASPPRWALASAVPRRAPDGRVVDVVCTLTDITPRKQMERSLIQAQKMESIGRLAGGIAHDFNNLLTAVLGGAELASLEIDEAHPAQEDLRRVAEAAERGAALTHQLLGYARKQPIQPRVIDMAEMVSRALGMIERLIGEDVRLHFAPRAGIRTRLDPGQFDQVLLNLAVNARDAMRGGGALHIEVDERALLTSGEPLPDSPAVLRVRDTGEGMSPEVLPRIFDPFFSTKAVGEGTGLGLAVCIGITKQNGGVIAVESEPGRGTTFEVIFPRVRARADPTRRVSPSRPVDGYGTVLLVEDDGAVRETARRALTRAGFSVITARNGRAALGIIESGPSLHGVVTDVVMPDLSGRPLADAIAEHRPGVPILFTSGHADDLLGEHGIIRQGVDFLPKPYTSDALCRRVRQLISRRSDDP